MSVFFLGFDFYIVWVVISQFSSFASNPKLPDGSDPLNRWFEPLGLTRTVTGPFYVHSSKLGWVRINPKPDPTRPVDSPTGRYTHTHWSTLSVLIISLSQRLTLSSETPSPALCQWPLGEKHHCYYFVGLKLIHVGFHLNEPINWWIWLYHLCCFLFLSLQQIINY